MKNKYTLLGIIMVLMACEEQVLDMPDCRVSLEAVAQKIDESTSRAIEGVDIHRGTSVVNMPAAVWFSNSDGVYPESSPVSPTFLPFRANLSYEEGSTIVYTRTAVDGKKEDPVSYVLEGADKVYCIGLYPQSEWVADAENKKVTHEVNGKQDLMFAPQQSGSLQQKIEKQTYQHLLAWLKFTIRANDQEAIADWGKINRIDLLDAKGTVTVTLGTGALSYEVSTSADNDMQVLDASIDLAVAIQDIGSALCIPADSYQLRIETEKKPETILTVEFKDASNAVKPMLAGQLYLVNLYFNKNDEINAVCSLVPWNEENVDLN